MHNVKKADVLDVPFTATGALIIDAIDRFLRRVIQIAETQFSGKFCHIKIVMCTVLLALLSRIPNYANMTERFEPAITKALSLKIEHPFSPIPPDLKDRSLYGGSASHVDKLDYRLTLPILGHLTHTGIWTVIVWSHLSSVGVFYLLARLASRAIGDSVGAGLFVLGLAPTYFGTWFFNDVKIGDGVGFFFLLLSIATAYPLVSFFSFVIAGFNDERCVGAAPLLLVYLWLTFREDHQKRLRLQQYWAIVAGIGAWLLLRAWLSTSAHLAMGTSMLATFDIVRQNLNNLPEGLIPIFNASWALPAVALVGLVLQRKWLASSVFIGAFAIAVFPAFLVVDFARSVCYTFVVLVISVLFLWGDKDISRKILSSILLGNILLNAHYSAAQFAHLLKSILQQNL